MSADIPSQNGQSITVCVVGLGYIGLPTALIATQKGCTVIGYDIDAKRVQAINNGDPCIAESELESYLAQTLATKRFYATTTPPQKADYICIAVPTPCTIEKKADISYVMAALYSLISSIKSGTCIILESTVPIGTTEKIAALIAEKTKLTVGVDVFVAYCPERVIPGAIFEELVSNSRVIGGITPACAQLAAQFYGYFVRGEIRCTTARAAELVKLIENSSRDVALALAYEVVNIAEAAELNAYDIIELANQHPRVNILHPRAGVGGHCIALDPYFLIEGFPAATKLLQTARNINNQRPIAILEKIKIAIAKSIKTYNSPCHVLILGLTYKPNVDDLRESPALWIAQELTLHEQTIVHAYEPHVSPEAILAKKIIAARGSLQEEIAWAHICVYLVDHTVFKQDFAINATASSHAIILDFCGITTARNCTKHIENFETKIPTSQAAL